MKPVDLTKLPDYLQGQRWFGSKGLPIKNIALVEQALIDLPASTVPAGPFVVAIIEVTYELGPRERYQLHVCASSECRPIVIDGHIGCHADTSNAWTLSREPAVTRPM